MKPRGAHKAKAGQAEGDRGILDRVVPGWQESRIVLAACRLDIFNALDEGQRDAGALAARLGLDPRGAEVLGNALAALGLLEKKGGVFSLAEVARRHLVAGRPGYLGRLFLHQERMVRRWDRLEDILRGKPFPPLEEDRESVEEFMGAMDANASRMGPGVAARVDLKGVRRLLDLGGGPGTYARLFLGRSPKLTATLFDRPEIVRLARRLPPNRSLGDRLRYRSGDFLEDPLGRGYDLIWASNAIHSLGPDEILRLLARCRAALAPGGRMAIHDFRLNDEGTAPVRPAVFSVHMVAMTPAGRTYTRKEIGEMMRRSGFANVRTAALFENTVIVEGRRG
jgi:SAM-dependent methyltransferase